MSFFSASPSFVLSRRLPVLGCLWLAAASGYAADFRLLPNPTAYAGAYAPVISRDGSTVAANEGSGTPFRVDLGTNLAQSLSPFVGGSAGYVISISGNGTQIGGYSFATYWRPTIWTSGVPSQPFGTSTAFIMTLSLDGSSYTGYGYPGISGYFVRYNGQVRSTGTLVPADASGDGRFVAGYAIVPYGGTSYAAAAIFDASTGQQTVLDPTNPTAPSQAVAVSDDGNTAVVNKNGQAYRWTRTGGLELLTGSLNTLSIQGAEISADGKTIVGRLRTFGGDYDEAFIWTQEDGVRTLASVLTDQGIVLPEDPYLQEALDITIVNGAARIVGQGENRIWVANLNPPLPPLTPAPSPWVPGVPVDLNGSYRAARNASVGATTDRNGLPVVLKQTDEPGSGYRHLPFFPRKLPMLLDGMDLRGRAYGFDVDLGAPTTWPNPASLYSYVAGNVPEGGEGTTLVVRAASSAGTGPIDLSNANGLRVSFYRKDGRFFGHVKNLWYSQDVALPGATVATKYRVRVDLAANGAVKICFTQQDGVGAGAKATVNLVGGSIEQTGLTSASFAVQMLNKTTPYAACATQASVQNFWTNAANDTLYAFAAQPYYDTLGKPATVTYGLYVGALTKKISGYQTSLTLLGGGTNLTFQDGQYENDDLFDKPNPPVFAPTPGGRFDHAQAMLNPALAVDGDLLLETLAFAAPINDINTGRARLRVLTTYGTNGQTRLFGSNAQPFGARVFEGNDVVLDAAAPVLGNIVLKQGGTAVATPKHGTVDLSIVASDNSGSGLGDFPVLTATLTNTQNVVSVVTVRLGSADPATGAFGTTLNLPLGTKTVALSVKVADRVGHEATATRTSNVTVPASPTLSIPIQLNGFAAAGSVQRVVRVVLGRQGGDGIVGTKARVVIDKVVTFDKTGKGTLTLNRADGMPEFADAGITHVSVKDPYHTVGKRLALTLTGTTYSVTGGLTATLLPGDLNNDNLVDNRDLAILIAKKGTTVSPNSTSIANSGAAVAAASAHADLNGDGKVDAKDEAILNANFGRVGDAEPENYK